MKWRASVLVLSVIVDENLRAFTRCWMTRLVITRCEIVFRDVEVVRSNTTLHELGHTFGLNHSPDRSEVMGVRRVRSPEGFSPRERLAMTLMLKRLPGNLFADNDRLTRRSFHFLQENDRRWSDLPDRRARARARKPA